MREALIQPILDNSDFQTLLGAVKSGKTALAYAMAEPVKPYLAAALSRAAEGRLLLIITATEQQALRMHGALSQLAESGVYLLPPREITFYHTAASSRETMYRRVDTLSAISSGAASIVVASADAALARLMPRGAFAQFTIRLSIGEQMQPAELIRGLVNMGYERVDRVEAKGQCAMRGGILDVYPPDAPDALRVEFFDDEIDSIRYFSTETQRSQANCQSCVLTPASEMLLDRESRRFAAERIEDALKGVLKARGHAFKLSPRAKVDTADITALPSLDDMRVAPVMATRHGTADARLTQYVTHIAESVRSGGYPAGLDQFVTYCYKETQSLLDWLPGSVPLLDEPDKIRERVESRCQSFEETFKDALERGEAMPGQSSLILGMDEFFGALSGGEKGPVVLFSAFMRAFAGMKPEAIVKLESVGSTGYQGAMRDAAEDIRRWRADGWRVALMTSGASRGKRLAESLAEHGVSVETRLDAQQDSVDEFRLKPGTPTVIQMSMAQGFVYADARFAVLTDSDLYGAALRKARQMKKAGERIASFTDLKIGDYVVHEMHGVGMYKGIVRLQSEGHWREYLFIQYQDSDKLYVPTDQMDRVQKYIGGDALAPKLNRLGGSEWSKQKAKVKQSIRQLAFDLVKLYAQRSSMKGHAFNGDTPWQTQFEDYFQYEETPDQLQAVDDIKRDMESVMPMDRLLCGDVGYGKTEVALRAAFKAVMDGMQVALLAPTTVLTQQHFHTIKERFQSFPIRVDSISRFKTAAQQKEILKKVAQGEIDILVGTHRLLAKDVKFKSLGLLVVDEEQRFGVAHKESIKNIRRAVDVLTLSATPIPRTLHMSMVGIRDMSLLETPPEERYPVQTYVLEYSDGLVRNAILRELSRGGQVYMVYNHVETIENIYLKLKDLVPEARVAVGHGQMREHMLEDVMMDFYDGRYDVLLCTTIIESGLDVPRANTLIVCEADHFGLAQLYQLRGRVGRSNRIAYAYLTLQPDRAISETADKRLQAIREFTEFGSGYRIAMRDLEIRGAGNLLGAEQSGFLSVVGYDMYCKLLEQSVRELRGEEPADEPIETRVEFHVDAFLPVDYILDEKQRIELYHRIASLESRAHREDLEDELVDRFGDIPEEVNTLMDIALLKYWLNSMGVDLISHRQDIVRMRFSNSAKIDGAKLFVSVGRADSRLSLEPGAQTSMVLRGVSYTGLEALRDTLKASEKLMERMAE